MVWWINTMVLWINTRFLWINTNGLVDQHNGLVDQHLRQCRGQVARLAAVYHFKLCRAILVGIRKQLDIDGKTKPGDVGMLDDNFEQDPIGHGRAGGGCLWRFECGKGYVLNMDVVRDGAVHQDDLTG